ncbi:hypothetical protein J2X46_001057 [Nocardioides sp. BE266]|uniref:O-antigen ligase family protein n=1 Tax=Nocardioides sp. BE266 TaxID=2817725 RepID=UPI0028589154|nr:O-antigen ligase family protein [Nocardioides sp. BE266]MDR7252081.1 hypothetical protein [Nocardioides sp. BE266]
MPNASRVGIRQMMGNEVLRWDARSLAVAGVAALSFVAPNLAWREGALLCLLVLLTSLRTFRPAPADFAAIGLTGLAFTSLLWTSSTALTVTTSVNLATSVVVFMSVRAVCRRRRDVVIVGSGMIAGATIAVLAAAHNASGFRLAVQATADRVGVNGVNVNFTAYSLVTAAAVMSALVVFRRNRSDYYRLAAAGAFLAVVYLGVVLTGARGAMLSLVGLVVWLVASRFLPRLVWWALIVVFVISNAAIALGWSDALLRRSATGSTRETGDLNGRLGVWPLARHVFEDNWLLGGGAGSLPSAPGNTMGINAHAVVLDVAAGLGSLGIVAFASVWILALREPMSTADTRVIRAVGAFLVVSLPVILTGFWFESIVLWSAIAFFSRVDVLALADGRSYSDEVLGVTDDR